MTSLTYYVIGKYGQQLFQKKPQIICFFCKALNGSNFGADPHYYVAGTGLTEVVSYIVPYVMFKSMGRKMVALTLFSVAGIALLSVLLIPIGKQRINYIELPENSPNPRIKKKDHSDIIIGVALFGRTCISAVFAVVILQTSELFPTNLRSSALGTSSTMAHLGSISAPYIADLLGLVRWYIPTTICGGAAVVAGLLVLLVPETHNVNLDEVE